MNKQKYKVTFTFKAGIKSEHIVVSNSLADAVETATDELNEDWASNIKGYEVKEV